MICVRVPSLETFTFLLHTKLAANSSARDNFMILFYYVFDKMTLSMPKNKMVVIATYVEYFCFTSPDEESKNITSVPAIATIIGRLGWIFKALTVYEFSSVFAHKIFSSLYRITKNLFSIVAGFVSEKSDQSFVTPPATSRFLEWRPSIDVITVLPSSPPIIFG